MATVELIYDSDCPNVKGTREHMLHAFNRAQHKAQWQEWDRAAEDSPDYVRHFGSPTVLVDGRDIAGEAPSPEANCCRMYEDGQGKLIGVPSVELIIRALLGKDEVDSANSKRGVQTLALLPAIGSALLPKLTCPLCWPAYASLLSAVGLGFVDYTPYLLPLTSAFLLIAIASIGYHARKKQHYIPLVVGVASAVMVWAAKFIWVSDWVTYGGIAVLIAASIWGTWPTRRSPACPACA